MGKQFILNVNQKKKKKTLLNNNPITERCYSRSNHHEHAIWSRLKGLPQTELLAEGSSP